MIALLCAGLFSVAACGSDADTETSTTDADSTAEPGSVDSSLSFPIVDTAQCACYDDSDEIDCPAMGEAFSGQDAQTTGYAPSYTDNGDGTVTDNVTGLVWLQSGTPTEMATSTPRTSCPPRQRRPTAMSCPTPTRTTGSYRPSSSCTR